MKGYVLDTDTCIHILRGNAQVIRQRRSCYLEVVTTEITASELYYGAAFSSFPSQRKAQVDAFLETIKVVPVGRYGAQFFGGFKAQLRKAGMLIPDADLWIGSIARSLDYAVVTGNDKHMGRIPGLKTVNWIY